MWLQPVFEGNGFNRNSEKNIEAKLFFCQVSTPLWHKTWPITYTSLEDFDTLTVVLTHKAQGEYQGTIAQSTPPYPQRRRARHAATSSPLSLLQNPSPLPKRERPDHWKATRLDWEVQTYSWYAAQNSLMEAYKLGPRNSQGFRTSHCVTFCLGNVGVPGAYHDTQQYAYHHVQVQKD